MEINSARSIEDQTRISVRGFSAATARMPSAVSRRVPAQAAGSFSARTTAVQITAAANAARDKAYGQDIPSASQVGEKKKSVTGCQGVRDMLWERRICQRNI